MFTHSNAGFNVKAIEIVLILLDLTRDLRHFASFAEVNETLTSVRQEVGVRLLREQNVGQIHPYKHHHQHNFS